MKKEPLVVSSMASNPNDVAVIVSGESSTNTDLDYSLDEHHVVAEYHLRLSALVLIKQLMHLCRDIQKHRGLGMGLLAGNQEFAAPFEVLQKQMARRMYLLSAFSRDMAVPFSHVFTHSDMAKINEAWGTIREGWYDDSVLENFQFHNYFVEQLLQMVTKLTHRLQSDAVIPTYLFNDQSAAVDQQDELLVFICGQLPKMIEYLGMVRALASHSATVGHHIEDHDKKLKYLCQCVQTEKLQMIRIAEKLHQSMGSTLPALLVLQTYGFKVDAFIDKVMKQVVGQEHISLSSDVLFSMATEIMDVHWRVVDDGIDVLHHAQDEAVERWCIK
jgi:hypothetical protein